MPKVSFAATSQTQALNRLLLVGDAVLIAACIPVSYWIQESLKGIVPLIKDPPKLTVFATLAILVLPLWFFFITHFKLNEMFDRLWKRRELIFGMAELHAALLIIITLAVFLTQVVMNRSLIAVYMACTFVTLMAERMIIQYRMRYRLRQGSVRKHLLLVGDEGDEMRSFVNDAIIQDVQTLIVGRIGAPFAGPENVSSSHELVRIGDIGDLGEMLHIKAVDQVMFFPPFHDPSSSSEALKECEALGVPACFYVHVGRPLISVPRLISLHRRPFFIFELAPKRPEMLALKYTFDTLSAAFGLLVISPLLFVTGLLILITMGRPVFFSQVRSGLFGREFHMHKFRTMVKGAESRRDELKTKNEMDGPVFKITHDPRVTRLGRFLRKWSIDELPQLFNVLVGDMSLVGPRPLPIREQKEIVGWQRRRLSMRPGITGLWQVSGRNDVNFEQWMKLDLEYVDRWSFWTDCKILMKTVRVVLTGKGAS